MTLAERIDRVPRKMYWALNTFFAIWIIVEIWAGVFWEAENFQRLGALVIAALILTHGISGLIVEQICDVLENRPDDPRLKQIREAIGLHSPEEQRLFALASTNGYGTLDVFDLARVRVALRLREARQGMAGNELTIAAIATIQWGYGDCIHNLFHGNGWTPC